jgi:hypothetical protein
MLLSSVLQILAGSQLEAQPKLAGEAAAGFQEEMLAASARECTGDTMEEAAQAAAGVTGPSASEEPPKPGPPPGPSVEGLLQMITKLQEEDQSRFLDLFE